MNKELLIVIYKERERERNKNVLGEFIWCYTGFKEKGQEFLPRTLITELAGVDSLRILDSPTPFFGEDQYSSPR
jgi:hypothetical protein